MGAARGEADEVAQGEVAGSAGDDEDGGGEALAEGVRVERGGGRRLVVGVEEGAVGFGGVEGLPGGGWGEAEGAWVEFGEVVCGGFGSGVVGA